VKLTGEARVSDLARALRCEPTPEAVGAVLASLAPPSHESFMRSCHPRAALSLGYFASGVRQDRSLTTARESETPSDLLDAVRRIGSTRPLQGLPNAHRPAATTGAQGGAEGQEGVLTEGVQGDERRARALAWLVGGSPVI